MQQILCQQAEEGMVIGKDVLTPEGRVLCGKGTSLTAAVIARFIKMEVLTVTVEGHPVKVEGEQDLRGELLSIEHRFSKVKNVPPLIFLKKLIMKRLVASRKEE